VLNRNTSVKTAFVKPGIVTFSRGNKFFELSNHLGNVLVTVSDKKTAVDDGTYEYSTATGLYTKINSTPDGKVDYYTADIVTAQDYYPFGMMMLGRKYTATTTSKYRYSINGQEKETELNENITTAMYWEYDSRIGRRWNRDPKPVTGISPYACFLNNPIIFVDIKGDSVGDPNNPVVLQEVVVHADKDEVKFSKQIRSIITPLFPGGWGKAGDRLLKAILESGKQAASSATGIINAVGSNLALGAGRTNPNDFTPGYKHWFYGGQRVGDVLSLSLGTGGTILGGGLTFFGSVTVLIPGVGPVTFAASAGAGIALAGYSIAVVKTAWTNIAKIEEIHDDVHDTPPGNADNPITDNSTKNVEKVNDKYLKDNGIDAHELKKEWLGPGRNSDYDIYRNKDNGELIIYKKGGKGDGIRTGEYIE
jgi:RHS repeat-associated protein